ncbi:hypothetical protein ACFOEK_12370 [Litoribrevibacter euphylliae]|uniref:STAS/SEC14 domain-containing protein n=1 Tax=Litoribrevibacter euphylliae TaxID=1834034 RepID=A0ABV7HJY5_9GAMM
MVKFFGSWNLETTRLYALEYKAVVSPLIHQDWAVVYDMRDWELATPESMTVFQSLIKWCFDKGLRSCIYVFEDSFIKQHYLKQITAKLDCLPESYSVTQMRNLDHAHDWLKTHGHDVDIKALMEFEDQSIKRERSASNFTY